MQAGKVSGIFPRIEAIYRYIYTYIYSPARQMQIISIGDGAR